MTDPSNLLLRDRLANERTLLAWLRTAVALMGFGVVVARFGVFLDTIGRVNGLPDGGGSSSRWMGTALLLTGTMVGALGAWRTRAFAQRLGTLGRPPGDGTLVITTALVTVLGLGLAVWVLLMG
jgi:putative membrane protein